MPGPDLDQTLDSLFLGYDWFAFVSHAFPNATITLLETGVQGVFFPALVFDERKLNLQLVVAEDSMDCNANPYLIDPGVVSHWPWCHII